MPENEEQEKADQFDWMLFDFETWLVSNPPEYKVRRWLMAVEAYYMRHDHRACEEQSYE